MADQAERLREIVRGNKYPNNQTRVIAVTSGKGGVGKTNCSVNLGIALAKLGARPLLVDADLGLANVDVILGMMPQYNLGHVILGEKRISDVIVNGPAGLRIIASGSGVYKLANLNEKTLEQCLQDLNEIEKYTDIMIIDTGAGLSKSVLQFVLAAGEVIVVTTPEPTAITDAYGVIKVIASSDLNLPIWLVVNMVRNEAEGAQAIERLTTVSKRFLGVELATLGYIPYDPIVSKAVKEQQPFMISHPRSMAGQALNQMARNLLSDGMAGTHLTTSFFDRLIEKFR
ncbi:MAG TPA: ATP-binding protein [Firmicutes bacterium]|jgi:flagellar biosynthesis protein FlhG|nr:ATP-binding protein [Bacillota bacterium]